MEHYPKGIEDILSQSRAADSEDRARAEQFRDLVRTEGWKTFETLLQARVQAFGDQLLLPLESADGALRQEWIKGAISGLLLAISLPASTISSMNAATSED